MYRICIEHFSSPREGGTIIVLTIGFADLASPVKAEDASGVVVEDRDLIRSKFHTLTVRGQIPKGKDLVITTGRRGQT